MRHEKENYVKPELKRHENLKTITLVSDPKLHLERHELYVGDEL